MATVLFVCTGNLCRSPSAAWFLADRLAESGPTDVVVESVGTMGTTSKVPPELQQEGVASGLDLSAHTPRRVDANTLVRSDVIIGMERSHVREIVLADPPAFAKTFTLKEIVRRGRDRGQRLPPESLVEWLERVGAGRRHMDLLGDSLQDDISDPMGGTAADYRLMLLEVAALTRALHSLVWPGLANSAEGNSPE
jgi:protein-tyrosine phosphatase